MCLDVRCGGRPGTSGNPFRKTNKQQLIDNLMAAQDRVPALEFLPGLALRSQHGRFETESLRSQHEHLKPLCWHCRTAHVLHLASNNPRNASHAILRSAFDLGSPVVQQLPSDAPLHVASRSHCTWWAKPRSYVERMHQCRVFRCWK